MYIFEIFNSALQNIRANKLRSFLTMLGIIIGISSVITIASIGGAIKQYITGEFAGMGTNVINLQMKASASIGKRDFFTLEDADLILQKVPGVTSVVPMAQSIGTVELQDKTKRASVIALNQHYAEIYSMTFEAGRFLNEHDVTTKKYVAVIDDLTAKKFFLTSEAAIGQKISININGRYSEMTVVGVTKSQGILSSFGENVPAVVYVPITIYQQVLGEVNINNITVLVSDMSKADELSAEMIRIIENRHNNSDKYTASQGFAALETVNSVLNMLTIALSAIAGISLVVGGIGVMNIMLVSVTERTREIGIRKAVGAKTGDIRIQFLSESVILCLIGGALGILAGFAFCGIIGISLDVSVPVSLATVVVAFIFSSAVGIFFGLYPAGKAARMDPIEALRHE
jgi:putative ABC transport system permease protein